MGRKQADCRSRWETFKPRLLAPGKQKRPGWGSPAAAGPGAPPSPRAGGWGAGGDPRAPGCWLWSRCLAWVKGNRGSSRGRDAPHCPPQRGEIPSGYLPLPRRLHVRGGVGSAQGTGGWGRRAPLPRSGTEGRGLPSLEAHPQSSGNGAPYQKSTSWPRL